MAIFTCFQFLEWVYYFIWYPKLLKFFTELSRKYLVNIILAMYQSCYKKPLATYFCSNPLIIILLNFYLGFWGCDVMLLTSVLIKAPTIVISHTVIFLLSTLIIRLIVLVLLIFVLVEELTTIIIIRVFS